MPLNSYRDEAGEFMDRIGAKKDAGEILPMIDEELALLRAAQGDAQAERHQIYDLLFLLFEAAAIGGYDLDEEWRRGRARKREKYPGVTVKPKTD